MFSCFGSRALKKSDTLLNEANKKKELTNELDKELNRYKLNICLL